MALHLFLMSIFILCSAYFSGMEAAIFSISKFRVKSLLFENIRGAKVLARLKDDSGKTLSTLLLLNDLVNIGASSMATIVISNLLLKYNLRPVFFYIFEVFLMASILLIFGEITPKTIALNNAEFFSLKFGFILEILNKLTMPFTKFTECLVHLILPQKRIVSVSEDDIRIMLAEAKKLNILNESEEQLGYRLLKFSRTMVEEIMVAKDRVVFVDLNSTIDQAMEIMKKAGHTRICVIDNNKVIGILYAKDLLFQRSKLDLSVTKVMRAPFIVLNIKPIDELLVEFRRKGIHFGIVCDKQNNFLGIITLNDVLKYLFGEIPEL